MRMRSDSDLRIRRQGMDHRHPRAHNFPGVCLPLTCANLLLAGWGYAALAPFPPTPPPLYSGTVYYATPVAPTMYGQGYDSGGYVSGGYYPPLSYPYNGY